MVDVQPVGLVDVKTGRSMFKLVGVTKGSKLLNDLTEFRVTFVL